MYNEIGTAFRAVKSGNTNGCTVWNMERKMIYLVDYENVSLSGLAGIEKLGEEDKVVVFVGNNLGSIPFEWHIRIADSRPEVKYIRCGKVSKNYLDFQLATFCGYLMAGLENDKVYVVSKDKGYDSVVDFWTENKPDVGVKRVESIDESLGILLNKEKNQSQRQRRSGTRTRGRRNNNNRLGHSAEAPAEVLTEEIRVEAVQTVEAAEAVEISAETPAEVAVEAEEVRVEAAEAVETAETAEAPAEIPTEEIRVEAAEVTEEPKPAESERDIEVTEKPKQAEKGKEQKEKKQKKKQKEQKEQKEQKASEPVMNKLSESTKKHIRQKIKDEQLKGGSYKTIYNIFMTEKAKNRFNTALVKAFQQERGNRIYKKLVSEFEEHLKSQKEE